MITFQWRKIHRSEQLNHSKLLDLNYKEDSSRADTKIQILLLPKGSNSEIFREERLVSKKRCFATPLLSSALLPDMLCNKNNAISPEAIGGGDNHSSHPKKLLTRLPPAPHLVNQDGCDVGSKGGGLRENKCLCYSQTLF